MDNIFRLVKASDYDRYFMGLLQPLEKRLRWMALCAFHAEIAKLPMSVSDPTIGLIRIAWWREALEEIQTRAVKKRHELVEALEKIPDLPFAKMELLLNAYEAEIEKPVAASLEDLEQRILRTTHVLHDMLHEKSTEKESLDFGLVGFLKSVFPLARVGKPPFPLNMANPDSFGSAAYHSAATDFIRHIAEKAKHAPAPMRYYLKQARKMGYNLLQHDITPRGFGYYVDAILRR